MNQEGVFLSRALYMVQSKKQVEVRMTSRRIFLAMLVVWLCALLCMQAFNLWLRTMGYKTWEQILILALYALGLLALGVVFLAILKKTQFTVRLDEAYLQLCTESNRRWPLAELHSLVLKEKGLWVITERETTFAGRLRSYSKKDARLLVEYVNDQIEKRKYT